VSLPARGPRTVVSHESFSRELRPLGGARLRYSGALFRALVRARERCRSRLRVGARERRELVKECEREHGRARLCMGAREKRRLVEECERERRGAVLCSGGDSIRGSRLV
jgi:hypothetical protein